MDVALHIARSPVAMTPVTKFGSRESLTPYSHHSALLLLPPWQVMSSASDQPTYPLAQEWWSSEGAISIYDESGRRLLLLPMEFMKLGQADTLGFVVEQLSNCYEEKGTLHRVDGSAAAPGDTVRAERLVFARAG